MKRISKNENIVFIGGCFVGLLFFIAIYGIQTLNFTNDKFMLYGYIEKDILQHYSGWMLYRNSPWQLPLGWGQNIAYPYGSAVSFTDSIPLFAIFFKLFRNLLPATFQYFGLFVLICFMLQGGFGALIANLFNKNIYVNILSSGLFVLCPVIIERAFRHCGLTAHFLILAAIYYYLKNKDLSGYTAYIPFLVINAFSVTIHPYFMPFTFGIMFAFCIERFVLKKEYFQSVFYLVTSIVLTLFVGYIIGLFSIKNSMVSYGYGLFNMNLNSFFNPVSKGFDNWSKFLTIRPFINDLQIEGFNYLGMGIIFSVPMSVLILLIKHKKDIFKVVFYFIQNYFGIIFSTLALFIFAIGDTISFGLLKIYKIPYPDFLVEKLFGIFRANGRFGWLLIYMILIFVIYSFGLLKKSSITCVILGIATFIQLFDISGVLISKHNYFYDNGKDVQLQKVESVITHPIWELISENYSCVYTAGGGPLNINIDSAYLFGSKGKASHTGIPVKIDVEKSDYVMNNLLNDIENGTLNEEYVVIIGAVPEKYREGIKNGGLSVYWIKDVAVIFNDSKISDKISEYKKYGDFEILDYPYIVPEQ